MIEIIYGDNRELAPLRGKSIAEAREQYKSQFDIPDRAQALLNGKTVNKKLEPKITLDDGDELSFAKKKVRAPILVTALLVALTLTTGAFAYGYVTDTVTLTAVSRASADFAKVSADTSDPPEWTVWGLFRGAITDGTLFEIDTDNSTYTGDLVATISIANGEQLSKVYRVLALKIKVCDSNGDPIDINASGGSADEKDFALLTVRNGAVDLFITQDGGHDIYKVKLDSGYYVSHIWGSGWPSGAHEPILFCDVGQR